MKLWKSTLLVIGVTALLVGCNGAKNGNGNGAPVALKDRSPEVQACIDKAKLAIVCPEEAKLENPTEYNDCMDELNTAIVECEKKKK